MKHILLVACFALLSAACVPNDSPIRILGAHSLKTGAGTCSAEDIQSLRGSLDISAAQSYFIQFDLASDLQQISTTVGGEVLAGPDRNDFIGTELVFSYTSTPVKPFDPPERLPIHMVIPAGSESGKSFIILDLFTQKAAERLAANVPPGESIEVAAKFEMRGHLASGALLRSNEITYPVQVFNSDFPGCAAITPAGGTPVLNPRALNGPCGLPGGQDGTQPGCCFIPGGDAGVIINPAFAGSCGGGA